MHEMKIRIEIQQHLRDVWGNRRWITAKVVAENEIQFINEQIKILRGLVAHPNDIRAVRITEEVIA